MEPIPVPEAARAARPDCRLVSMRPPPGVKDEDCGTAEMLVSAAGQIPGFDGRANYAYYRPSKAELESLRKGGFLEMGQYGFAVQPFSLQVWPAWEDPIPVPEEGEAADEITGITAAGRAALAAEAAARAAGETS